MKEPRARSLREKQKLFRHEEMDTDNEASMDQAMAAAILKAMKLTVAAISDPKQRKAVTDALFGAVGLGNDDSDISKLMKVVQKNAKKTVDGKSVHGWKQPCRQLTTI